LTSACRTRACRRWCPRPSPVHGRGHCQQAPGRRNRRRSVTITPGTRRGRAGDRFDRVRHFRHCRSRYAVHRVVQHLQPAVAACARASEPVALPGRWRSRCRRTGPRQSGLLLHAAAERQQFSREAALPGRHPVRIKSRMETTMHRFLAAVVLGTALLAGGGAVGTASARPMSGHVAPLADGAPAVVTPVRDGYYRPNHDYDRPRHDYYRPSHEAPPPRHWHQPAPRWYGHSWHERHDMYRYGWRR
jgi:hypothetical protein